MKSYVFSWRSLEVLWELRGDENFEVLDGCVRIVWDRTVRSDCRCLKLEGGLDIGTCGVMGIFIC